MPRFFISPADVSGNRAYIRGDGAKHFSVLRIGGQERFVVCDGGGLDYICRVAEQTAGLVTAEILESRPSEGEANLECWIYAAFPKGDKAESIVQKATELGAAGICFFPSARCVSRPDEKSLKKKLERLQRVALEAAQQCGRGRVPPVEAAASFDHMLARAAMAQMPLFLWEAEERLSLRAALEGAPGFQSAAIVTGPEGGFAPEEAAQAAEKGLLRVTVGKRILRCETAPVCALAALMYASGNL